MRNQFEIEDIEGLRRRQGINDCELRQQVRGLRAGDIVLLTLLPGSAAPGGEMVPVRITRVRGSAFRGELVRKPATSALAGVRAGSPVVFAATHIHSLLQGRPTNAGKASAAPAQRQRIFSIDSRGKGIPRTTKVKPPPRPVAPRSEKPVVSAVKPEPPASTEEHLRRIEAAGERINGHVRFMCAVGTLSGTSEEAKARAVAAFDEQMALLERELGRIAEELRLG
jgi:hypothetical protein